MADEQRVNYTVLYDLVRNEKSREELQRLDENVLVGVLGFLREQDARLADTAARGDMFSTTEADQLRSQLMNARRLVRELYERRERKIIDLALNRSRTASDLIDTTNLLPHERPLFDMIVTSLDAYRRGILTRVLALKEPEAQLIKGIAAYSPSSSSVATMLASSVAPAAPHIPAAMPVPPKPKPTPQGFCRVKFLAPVDQFVGQELELYGPFEQGEEADLPATVAEVLFAQKSAMDVSVRS
jgi:DNA replication initiation complex subunit (GINS family)